VLVVIGHIAYGVRVPTATLPAFALGVVCGSIVFCCLAFAITSFIGQEDSAQPMIQAIVLPLYFVSGVFVPERQLSHALQDIASVFPVAHLNSALVMAFDPATTGAGLAGKDLAILAIWGVGGLIVALWRFSWSPKST
jgi:ABC-2 type transport system permease protein